MRDEFKAIRANLQKRRQAVLAKISEEPPLREVTTSPAATPWISPVAHVIARSRLCSKAAI